MGRGPALEEKLANLCLEKLGLLNLQQRYSRDGHCQENSLGAWWLCADLHLVLDTGRDVASHRDKLGVVLVVRIARDRIPGFAAITGGTSLLLLKVLRLAITA